MNKSLFICSKCSYSNAFNENPDRSQILDKLTPVPPIEHICPNCKIKLTKVDVFQECNIKDDITINDKPAKCFYTVQAAQDLRMLSARTSSAPEFTPEEIDAWDKINDSLENRHLFGKILTPDLTNEEIQEYQKYDELLKNVNVEEIKQKYKVTLIREHKAYDYMHNRIDHYNEDNEWVGKTTEYYDSETDTWSDSDDLNDFPFITPFVEPYQEIPRYAVCHCILTGFSLLKRWEKYPVTTNKEKEKNGILTISINGELHEYPKSYFYVYKNFRRTK